MQPGPGEEEDGNYEILIYLATGFKKTRLILLVPDSHEALREDGDSGLEMRCGELESIGPAPLSDDAELCLSFTRTWGIKVLPG